jgi:DNA-binding beta-propeller fold protein YncE
MTTLFSASSYDSFYGLTFGPDGNLYTSYLPHSGSAGIMKIDMSTGVGSVISTGYLASPGHLRFASDGSLLVSDSGAFSDRLGGIIRVNVTTGEQSIVARGNYVQNPSGFAIESDGNLLVAMPGAYNRIVRINTTTGEQSILSHDGYLRTPMAMTWSADGKLLVADCDAGTPVSPGRDYRSGVLQIDPLTGQQTLLSYNGSLQETYSIATDLSGNILVGDWRDWYGGSSALLSIDPKTGLQTQLSSGDPLIAPFDLTVVVPEPVGVSVLLLGSICILRRRRRTAPHTVIAS